MFGDAGSGGCEVGLDKLVGLRGVDERLTQSGYGGEELLRLRC